ncbi:adenosine receptor A2b-like [Montipora capricornis]|uniref:adenosine receptor A2b-like n=1 Tax=Montipora capricornis TaxID=246305 RepID=UPI0035F1C332
MANNASNITGSAAKCGQNHWQEIALSVYIYMVFHLSHVIFSLAGNSLVFRAFYKFASLRTASNVIVVSLCAADSLIPMVYILCVAMRLSSCHSSKFLCIVTGQACFFLLSVIILHLALISVDRFIAVKFSLRYHSIVTFRRAVVISITAWLWVLAVTIILPQIIKAIRDKPESLASNAFHPCFNKKAHFIKGYLVFYTITLLFVPLVIILSSYSYIFLVSHTHRKRIREQNNTLKKQLRASCTLGIIVALCLASIIPLLVVASLRISGTSDLTIAKHVAFHVAFGLNAICNPIIYGWRNEKFRSSLRKLLKCA